MRMLVLAGAVAVAVVAVVVAVGLRLTGDDDPDWAEQATAACERGLGRARAVITAGGAIEPDEKRALALYAGATEIESDVLAELEALPRPSEDAKAIEEVLALVDESHRADLATIRRLRRAFDRALFERRVNGTVPVLAELSSRFGALGASGCVSYYDPDAYR